MIRQVNFGFELIGVFMFLCLVHSTFALCSRRLSEADKLEKYANLYTQFRFNPNGGEHRFHESFYAVGSCLSAAVRGLSRRVYRDEYVDSYRRSCRDVEGGENVGSGGRSFCPWVVTKNIDVNRYPMELETVLCSCKDCVNHNGFHGMCRAVPYYVRVLRKKDGCDENGVDLWLPSIDKIHRGCTCTVGQHA